MAERQWRVCRVTGGGMRISRLQGRRQSEPGRHAPDELYFSAAGFPCLRKKRQACLKLAGKRKTLRQLCGDHGIDIIREALGFDLANIKIESGLWVSGITTCKHAHHKPFPNEALNLGCWNPLRPPTQINDISEIHCILTADESAA